MQKINGTKIETIKCQLCGIEKPINCFCTCEGVQLLRDLDTVGGVTSISAHKHLFEKEYDALRDKIISLYTKEEFNFHSTQGKAKLIRNDYWDNFKGE